MIISLLQVNAVLESQSGAKDKKNTSCTKRRPFNANAPDPFLNLQVVTRIKEAVHNETEVRKDRVKILKSMITQGNYPISGKVIAEKMVNRSLVDSILSSKDNNK